MKTPEKIYVWKRSDTDDDYACSCNQSATDDELYIHKDKVVKMMRVAWAGGYDFANGINKSDKETSLMRLVENFYPYLLEGGEK